MNLIIVESPTKAKTLSRFLGKEYQVEATMGHIKDLPKSKLGVDVEHDFKPDYLEVEKQAETIKKLTKASKKAKGIYLATDPDREGEAIAAHVKEIVGDGKTTRIVFHEITKHAVEEAIAHPRKVDTHLVNAQVARRVLDRLVGYKLSPLLWKKIRRGLSAGRVQTVTVRLIVEREREIEKFKPDEYWEIASEVKGKSKFIVNLVKIDSKKAEVKNKKEADKVVADLKKAGYEVFDVRKAEVKKNPYPPFTTSTMTQAGARVFGWASRKTMSAAQKLYEEGLITYHRTDSMHLANEAVGMVRNYIKSEYGENYLPPTPRFYKTKSKSAQEAHEAIRPTDVGILSPNIKGKYVSDAIKLYKLIWQRFVACQMATSIYDRTTIDVKANKYLLRASGQTTKFDGWRKVMPLGTGDQDEPNLPEVTKNEKLDLVKVISDQKFTQPPPRYNEASIIKTLEKLGIGRPSTYAPTISTIQTRSYVEKKDGKFYPTPVGVAVNDFLIKNFPNTFEYEFTARMEDNLDKVAEGKMKWQKEIKDFWGPFDKKLVDVEKNSKRVKIETEKLGKKCPDCKEGELVIRVGRFGKFVSCSRFPDCKHTEKYLEKINMKCPDCKKGEVIVKKTGKGRSFFGCSRYPECEFASWKNPSIKKEEKENKDK